MSSSTQNTAGTTNGTSNSATNPWSVQQPYLTQAFGQAGTAENQSQSSLSSALQAYQQMLGYGTNMSTPNSSAAASTAMNGMGTGATGEGLFGLSNYNPASTNNANAISNIANQYVSGVNIPGQVAAAMQPAMEEANYSLNPGIDASAAATGNESSSRDAIEHGLVATNLGQTAANTGATLEANAYNTGANLGESALQSNNSNTLASLLGLTQGGTSAVNSGVNAGTGSVGQASGLYNIANTGVTGSQTSPFAALDQFYNIVGGNNWGSSTTGSNTGAYNGTTTTTPSLLTDIGSLIGGGGSLLGGSNATSSSGLLGLFNALKSDRRTKRDIEPIGTLDNGLTVYRFRYVSEPHVTQIGLMAQDVEKVRPDAVVEIDGIKFVNYDAATR